MKPLPRVVAMIALRDSPPQNAGASLKHLKIAIRQCWIA